MIHAGAKMYETIGPSRMALDGAGGMWLLSHGKLHHFGGDGMRREVADLAALGAPPRPSDFDLHRDGRAVLADPDTSQLVRCTLPKGPCERLPARLKTVPGQPLLPLNAAKVHVDDAGGRYFVSDNAGHQVVAMDFAGTVTARSRARTFRHPNQLALVAPDRLAVVDTDHHRIAYLDPSLAKAYPSMSTEAEGVARPLREWPFDAVHLAGGETAVLIAAPAMRDADLVFFDASGTARRRADLGADSDPFDVEAWRDKLWVSDATRYRIDAVNLDGTRAGTLEDAAFLAELDEARKEPVKWRWARYASQLGLVGFPLLGALLLWRLAPPAPNVPASAARPRTTAQRRFGIRARLLGRVRMLALAVGWGVLVLGIGYIAMVAFVSPVSFFGAGRHLRALATVAPLVAISVISFAMYRAIPRIYERIRLEIRPDGLRFRLPSRILPAMRSDEGMVPWTDVFMDDNRLLLGRRIFTYKLPFVGVVFEPADLQGLADALLAGHRVDRSTLTRTAWRQGAFRHVVWIILAQAAILALALVVVRGHL